MDRHGDGGIMHAHNPELPAVEVPRRNPSRPDLEFTWVHMGPAIQMMRVRTPTKMDVGLVQEPHASTPHTRTSRNSMPSPTLT